MVGISANWLSWSALIHWSPNVQRANAHEKRASIRQLSLLLIGCVALGNCFNDSDHRLPQHIIVILGLSVSQIIIFFLMYRNIFNFYEDNFSYMQSECLAVYGPCIIITIVTHLFLSTNYTDIVWNDI